MLSLSESNCNEGSFLFRVSRHRKKSAPVCVSHSRNVLTLSFPFAYKSFFNSDVALLKLIFAFIFA